MRHGKRFNHLGRKTAHRKAMLANMACSLIEHKRINTTVAKAKALRQFVEPIITRSKDDSTHSRRVVFRYLRSKYAVSELFRNVAPAVSEREGGYTRIIKTGFRPGDSAEMCLIELVDFNGVYDLGKTKTKKRTRRGGAKKLEGAVAVAETAEVAVEEEVVTEGETKEVEATTEVAEEVVTVEETKEAEATTEVAEEVVPVEETKEAEATTEVAEEVVAVEETKEAEATTEVAEEVVAVEETEEAEATTEVVEEVATETVEEKVEEAVEETPAEELVSETPVVEEESAPEDVDEKSEGEDDSSDENIDEEEKKE